MNDYPIDDVDQDALFQELRALGEDPAAFDLPDDEESVGENVGLPARQASTEDQAIRDLYAQVVEALELLPDDEAELRKKRGLSGRSVRLAQIRSCCPENKRFLWALKDRHSEELLLKSGLYVLSKKGTAVPLPWLTQSNLLIPFFGPDSDVVHLRPHKLGLPGRGIHVYIPRTNPGPASVAPGSPLIIAESEFKALAAVEYGYQAIGVPGIASFSGKHFHRLVELLETEFAHVARFVVLFDTEEKGDPDFENFKHDPRKRFDTDCGHRLR